jgi:hypothetical protein
MCLVLLPVPASLLPPLPPLVAVNTLLRRLLAWLPEHTVLRQLRLPPLEIVPAVTPLMRLVLLPVHASLLPPLVAVHTLLRRLAVRNLDLTQ